MEQNHNGSVVKQRIVRTEEQILAILEEYEKSGFTQKEFCEVSDINEVTFYSWLKKYRSKTTGEEVKGFATIEVVPSSTTRPQLFAEIGIIKLYKEVSPEYLKALLS
jgi:hypothetical protein